MSIEFLGMQLDSPFVLAPMAGITDGAFRYVCRKNGAALTYTEMISAKGLFYNSRGSEELMLIEAQEGPVGMQFFGCEPEMLARAARSTNERPNVLFDINMGCPVPKVVRNGEGSALLKNPGLAAECVKAAAEASAKPVTVKMRRGFAEKLTEGEIDSADFARMMQEAGAAAITVHGRTREQYYSGKADWDAIKRIVQSADVPVIGNGDVFSAEDACRMLDQTGCRLVMIARGSLGNPWIFREAKALYEGRQVPARPDLEEITDLMKEQILLAVRLRGAYVAVHDIRQHIGYYSKGIRGGAEFRRRANTARSLEELLETVESLKNFNVSE